MNTTSVAGASAPVSEPATRPPVGLDSAKRLPDSAFAAAGLLSRSVDDGASVHVD